MKRRLTLLLIILAITSFLSCSESPESIILEQAIREALIHESPYTGGLQPIGNVKKFGRNVEDPIAIEWNGQQLYMLAEHGVYPNRAQYLFTLDRNTGIATFVNRAAKDLDKAGSHTQVAYVSPTDMTWFPPPDHYIEGIDYPIGYRGEMLASCPVLDSIVAIDLETGTATRINWVRDFCLSDENGRHQFGAPRGLAYDGIQLFIGAFSLNATADAQLLSLSTGNLRCAKPLTENQIPFNVGETSPYSLCFDEEFLYMSGADTNALHIVNRKTGEAYFIANWYYATLPEHIEKHPIGDYLNTHRNVRSQISITGLAFDGTDMLAVDAFSNTLYRLERN